MRRNKVEDWFWACGNDGPAGDKFIIANGQDELWRRVRREISADEHCAWDALHRGSPKAEIQHILDMLLTVVHPYQVNHNKFMFEAAKIPSFAKFLREGRCDLCNYVSNPSFHGHAVAPEPFSDENMRKLGRIVNDTLGIDDDWF